jgi:serine/threonine-protein kinase
MSTVYLAENPRLGNVIALKIMAPELVANDVFRSRFLEESRIAAAMNHPHVIPIHDMGSTDELLFIAMRAVTGTDLRQMLKKRGRLQPDTGIFLLSQAARALDAAHRRGLVHRDVKPGNLLVERGSDDAEPDHVYLADFGITKLASGRSGLTNSGHFLGTIDYVAPEQIRGLSVLGTADQYSLGCVLYECLTGQVPFEKDLDAAIIWAHVEEAPTRPTVIRPDLPAEVDEVFARVLAKDPADRYQSCREFMAAARDALGPMAGEPLPGGTGGTGGLRVWQPAPVFFVNPEVAHDMAAIAGDPAAGMLVPPAYLDGADEAYWSAAGVADGATDDGPGFGPGDGSGFGPGDGPGGGIRDGQPGQRRRWLFAFAALALVAAGVGGAWWALNSGAPGYPQAGGLAGSTPSATVASSAGAMSTASSMSASALPTAAASASMPASMPASGSELMQAVVAVAGYTKDLQASSCKQVHAFQVTCGNPDPSLGIGPATFLVFPSRSALYAAYQADARKLEPGFRENYLGGCDGNPSVIGEAAWSHDREFFTSYSIAQMTAGTVGTAAGRVFCTNSNGIETFVWTQNQGNMLAYVSAYNHTALWTWWVDIHHYIGIGAPPDMGGMVMPSASPSAAMPSVSSSGSAMSSGPAVTSGAAMPSGTPAPTRTSVPSDTPVPSPTPMRSGTAMAS